MIYLSKSSTWIFEISLVLYNLLLSKITVFSWLGANFSELVGPNKTIIGTLSEDKNLTWIKASAKDNIVLTLSRALTDAELSKYESTLDSSEFKLYYASNMYDNGNPKLSTKGNPLSPTLTICDNNGDYLNDTVTCIMNA